MHDTTEQTKTERASTATAKRLESGGEVIAHRTAGLLVTTDAYKRNTGTLRTSIGTGNCICGQCGHGFMSLTGFDKHQTLDANGGVICWSPESIGMVRNKHGWWVTALDDGTWRVS
jgi:hypothetical protein